MRGFCGTGSVCTIIACTLAGLGAGDAAASTFVVDKDKVQCKNAGFSSIQAAVNAAAPGDRVKVCPDLYTESVTVTKPLRLTGARGPRHCFDPTAPDPTDDSIIQGPGFDTGVRLSANDVLFERFVVQGWSFGMETEPAFSGYDLRDNLFQSNVLAMRFGSSGATRSDVRESCFRTNPAAGPGPQGFGISMEDTRNARVLENDLYRHDAVGISLQGGVQEVEEITVAHNRSAEDAASIFLSDVARSQITHNRSDSPVSNGIDARSPTLELVIAHNQVRGAGVFGVLIGRLGPTVHTGLSFEHNDIRGSGTDGVTFDDAAAVASEFSHNLSLANGGDGFLVRVGNNGNVFAHNGADDNGSDGIHSQGATGNRFEFNHMFGNAEHDAHDDARPTNEWINNRCETDLPPGTICNS